MNKEKRYRLSDNVAIDLGLKLKETKRYTLNEEQEKKYLAGKKIKRLFFDIETSPNVVYSWRTGWNITIDHNNIVEERKIICVSYKWEHENEVYNIAWNGDDKIVLEKFIPIMNQADEVIGHNGDRFDIKWLRTRALFHRLPMFPFYRTLDTLKKARSYFNFNSNRLDYIGKFLGVGEKQEHEGFDLWKKVKQGDEDALQRMIAYCNNDVVLLEDVYQELKYYVRQKTNTAVHTGGKKFQCPICASKNVSLMKTDVTPKGTIKRIMKCECSYVYDITNKSYMNKFVPNS